MANIPPPVKGKPIRISSVTFGLMAGGVMLLIASLAIHLIHLKYPESRHSKILGLSTLALTIGLWLACWREDGDEEKAKKKSDKEAEKKGDKKGDKTIANAPLDAKVVDAIPDGHIGILEVMDVPVKGMILTEGKAWIPPYIMDIKAHDMRQHEFQVPTTAEEIGIEAITSDNVQVYARVSVPIQPDPDYLLHLLFKIGMKTAVNALRNAIVDQVRSFIAGQPAEKITKANTQERKDMADSIKIVVKDTAERLGFMVAENDLKIPKIAYADEAVKKALEALVTRIGLNKGVNAMQEAKDKRVIELTNAAISHGVPSAEAYTQARKDADLEFGLSTRQEILTGGGTNLLVGAHGQHNNPTN